MSNNLHFSQANPGSPILSAHIKIAKKGDPRGRPVNVMMLRKNGLPLYVYDTRIGAIRKIK